MRFKISYVVIAKILTVSHWKSLNHSLLIEIISVYNILSVGIVPSSYFLQKIYYNIWETNYLFFHSLSLSLAVAFCWFVCWDSISLCSSSTVPLTQAPQHWNDRKAQLLTFLLSNVQFISTLLLLAFLYIILKNFQYFFLF